MKYALVKGNRQQATKGMRGSCIACGAETVSKCGNQKIHHWAHKSKIQCDPWWERETEWHRAWKNHFPADWQEQPFFDPSGVKHVADVRTSLAWVLEFQNSPIDRIERDIRTQAYGKIFWVVNGLKYKYEKAQFAKALANGQQLPTEPVVKRVEAAASAILSKWIGTDAPVFFDFGEKTKLWLMLPLKNEHSIYILPFSRRKLIELHLSAKQANLGAFVKWQTSLCKSIDRYELQWARKLDLLMSLHKEKSKL